MLLTWRFRCNLYTKYYFSICIQNIIPRYIPFCCLASHLKWKWQSLSRVQHFWPHGLYSPWNSPGQITGVGNLSLLQGIFPALGSNPGLRGFFTSWATREAHFLCRFSQLWPFPLIAFVSPFKILAQDFSHLFLYVGSSIAFTFLIVVVFLPIFPELVNFLNQYIFFLNSYITSLLFVYFINSFESWILGSLVSPSFYCRNIFLLYGLFPRSSMLWLLYSFLVFEGHEFSYTILSAGDSYGRGAREVFQANRNRACMWIFFYL